VAFYFDTKNHNKTLFDNTLKQLSKRDILEKCPDINTSTIEVALAGLLKEGYIRAHRKRYKD